MKLNLSLAQRFSGLLALFVGITVFVLIMMVAAKNEPINFGKQELKGDQYQRPLEDAMHAVMKHRIVAQRALYGEKTSLALLPELATAVDKSLQAVAEMETQLGEDLQFTDAGLTQRKREHLKTANLIREWTDLKGKVNTLKPEESNDLHAHLIADLRGMVAHSGDTSNLILDPDLDSYYLMDITLLALPQSQDRIQNVIVQIEPLVRRQEVSLEDRIKTSVAVSMMTESDLERIKADFQTVLNEDPNFFGKMPSLEKKLAASHEKFVTAYKNMIDFTQGVADGKPGSTEKFIEVSNAALTASFDYWNDAVVEMDNLLENRVAFFERNKMQTAALSVVGLLMAIGVSWMFMRYLQRNMRQIVTVLNRSSHEVSGASAQSASSAATLSEASTEQAASLQETMASIEEISAMVSQNAESATKTKDAVDANQKVSEEGSNSVNEMLSAINEIRVTNEEILLQMETSNKEFSEIVKIISEIGNKTNVINEIVFQTKLLSFNASVEAARAGEHGKGFAVVAEEVGNLAQMSGNAAKEITNMLSDSIKKVNEIVENTKVRVDKLVEVGKDKISMGHSTAQKCRESLNKITENARAVASMITEITHASKEQAQGIQEINKAISQLDQVTQQNSAVAQQSSSQAEQLNNEANSLSDAVTQLTVFVEGHEETMADPPTHEMHGEEARHEEANKVVRIVRRTSKKGGGGRGGKPRVHHPVAKHSNGNGNGNYKIAASGHQTTPSSQDPTFEEF